MKNVRKKNPETRAMRAAVVALVTESKFPVRLKLSRKVARHLQVFRRYAHMTGVPVEEVLDKYLGKALDEETKKGA